MVKTLHARTATSEKDFEEYEEESEPNMKFSHALIVVLLLHVLAVGGVFAFNTLKGRHIAPDRTKPAAAGQAASASAPDVVTTPGNKTAVPTREAAPALPIAPNKTPPKSQLADVGATTHTAVAGDTLTRIATSHKTTVEAIVQANGLASNSAIRVGQVLRIPAKSNAAKIPAKQETPAAKTSEVKPQPVARNPEVKPAPLAKSPEVKPVPAVKNPEVKPAPVAKTTGTTAPSKPSAGEPSKADTKPAASDKTYTVAKGDNPYAIAKKLKVKYNDLIKANNIQDPTKLQIGQKLIVP